MTESYWQAVGFSSYLLVGVIAFYAWCVSADTREHAHEMKPVGMAFLILWPVIIGGIILMRICRAIGEKWFESVSVRRKQ